MRADIQPYVPVVWIVSQNRASRHSLEQVSPSIVEGTYTPSVPPEVQTPEEANGSGVHLQQTLARHPAHGLSEKAHQAHLPLTSAATGRSRPDCTSTSHWPRVT